MEAEVRSAITSWTGDWKSAQIPGNLTNFDVVEHITLEITCCCHYFLNYGGL